ncbi:MAG: helix-hairpin-helix domain-containing protein [Nitrospira sp.]|nr:helix-hairpin-helix domain-containing protein [Nitrospira sp.]
MKNQQIAVIFRNLAALLEIRGESLFRIRAYRKASHVVNELTEDIEAIAARGGLKDLPGIGKDLAAKIQEMIQTGTLAQYEEMKKETPPVLLSFLSLPGIQPRTAHYLYEGLGIKTLEDLEGMVRSHMLRTLPEINKEIEGKILEGIQVLKEQDSKRAF